MKRDAAIRELKKLKPALKKMGATSLYLFGSTARNTAGLKSDIDVFIGYNAKSGFSLFDVLDIRRFLRRELKQRVDVIPEDSLKPFVKKEALRDAIRVY